VSFGEDDDEDDIDSEEEPVYTENRYNNDSPINSNQDQDYSYEDDLEYQQYL
jgi:hypothetical protein